MDYSRESTRVQTALSSCRNERAAQVASARTHGGRRYYAGILLLPCLPRDSCARFRNTRQTYGRHCPGTSFRDSRGATAALMTPTAHAGNLLLGRPLVAALLFDHRGSIAPANYGKSWSILPYYASFLGPRGTSWLPPSECNFARCAPSSPPHLRRMRMSVSVMYPSLIFINATLAQYVVSRGRSDQCRLVNVFVLVVVVVVRSIP